MTSSPLAVPNKRPPSGDDHQSDSLQKDVFNDLLKGSPRPHTASSLKVRSLGNGSQSGHNAEPEATVEDDPMREPLLPVDWLLRLGRMSSRTRARLQTLQRDGDPFGQAGDLTPT